MHHFLSAFALLSAISTQTELTSIHDTQRDRHIPVEVSTPKSVQNCTQTQPCKVAFISAGYGVEHTKYQFISSQLNQLGYLTVAIGHELPSDPPLSLEQPFYKTRMENWQRGATTVDLVRSHLAPELSNYDFDHLLLVGHSNGGDISALLGQSGEKYVNTIITLDHRRVPLPRTDKINILSIRASDFPADPDVLPSDTEQQNYGSCIVKIDKSRHNDMSDYGPFWLKERINKIIVKYLPYSNCDTLQKL
ncbi:esterase [Pseudoalteromonas sp. A25]|uniref:alpha/beta hydrolase n=1 Tax=Pseudoalteromonas sp. A25 TaxID=116092 RepID=UPI0012A17A22|nr:alpha/beta hydrolase [Pseudoalteromonas sp. A25]BBN83848.1 esterase [Pseudoalteromonas sp. A25]